MKDVAKTKKSATPSAKGFQLTCNEIDKLADVLEYLRGLTPNYLLAGKEIAPTTGHKHAHIYVQFPNARRLSLKKLCGAHVEKCFGSPEQNVAYIKKPDTEILVEEGAPRLNYMPSIKKLKEMPKEEREGLSAVLYNIVAKVNAEEAKHIAVDDYYKEREVYYIYGESGAGKTKEAIKILKEKGIKTFNEIKCVNGFWHGVTESDGAALYDDFRYSHMSASEFINLIDYNRHTLNVKGGTVRNNYTLIIITSIQSPEDLYPTLTEKDAEPMKQWMRRMKKIEIKINN